MTSGLKKLFSCGRPALKKRDHPADDSGESEDEEEYEQGVITVTLKKTKKDKGLGLTISGGVDRGTTYPSVSHLRSGGVAERSEHLVTGDTILAVNGQTTANLTHEEIVNTLRNAGQSVKIKLWYSLPLNILNGNGEVAQKGTSLVCVSREGNSLGFVIRESTTVDRNGWCPIMVCFITPGSSIERDGCIQVGDVILSVNGQSLSGASRKTALRLLNQTDVQISLKIQYDLRIRDPVKSSSGSLFIDLEKPSSASGLGLSLETSPGFGQSALIISQVKDGSVADRCGVLHVGDQLLMINNTMVTGMPLAEAVRVLSSTGQHLRLEILPFNLVQQRDMESLSDGLSDHLSNDRCNNLSLERPKGVRSHPKELFSQPSHVNPALAVFMRRHDRAYDEKPEFARKLDFTCKSPEGLLERDFAPLGTWGSDGSAPGRINSGERKGEVNLLELSPEAKSSPDTESPTRSESDGRSNIKYQPMGKTYRSASSPHMLDRQGVRGYGSESAHNTLDRRPLAFPGNLRGRSFSASSSHQSNMSMISCVSYNQGHMSHVESVDVNLTKSSEREVFGLSLDERILDGVWPAFVITDVRPGSIGHSCGLLQINDRITAINGESTCAMNLEDIDYLLYHNTVLTLTTEFDVSDTVTPASGRFNVKLPKHNKNLGITIESANSTEKCPYKITDVVKGSLAHRSGAISVGDLLSAVNGCSLVGCDLSEVQKLINESEAVVVLTVTKKKLEPESLTYTVELCRQANSLLGINCVQEEKVVTISSLTKNSIAQRSGAVHVGDQIVAVNGVNTESMSEHELDQILKSTSPQVVRLKINRNKEETSAGHERMSDRRVNGGRMVTSTLVKAPFSLKKTYSESDVLGNGVVTTKKSLVGFKTLLQQIDVVSSPAFVENNGCMLSPESLHDDQLGDFSKINDEMMVAFKNAEDIGAQREEGKEMTVGADSVFETTSRQGVDAECTQVKQVAIDEETDLDIKLERLLSSLTKQDNPDLAIDTDRLNAAARSSNEALSFSANLERAERCPVPDYTDPEASFYENLKEATAKTGATADVPTEENPYDNVSNLLSKKVAKEAIPVLEEPKDTEIDSPSENHYDNVPPAVLKSIQITCSPVKEAKVATTKELPPLPDIFNNNDKENVTPCTEPESASITNSDSGKDSTSADSKSFSSDSGSHSFKNNHSTSLDMSAIESLDWKTHCVVLKKGRDTGDFGFELTQSVVDGGFSYVAVSTVSAGVMSVFSGDLKVGDILLEVNGVDVQNSSQSEVESLMKLSSNHLYLVVCRNPFDEMLDSTV